MMDKDMASAVGAGPSQAEPEVSALRASVPDAWPAVGWEHGYPTAEDDDFADWDGMPLNFRHAAHFIVSELPRAAANCCASCDVDQTDAAVHIGFSTGGWSGAESLLGFIARRSDTRYFMLSWRRGGHYEFEVPIRFLAQGTSAGTAETPEAAQGDSPPARSEGCAQ